jgi:hypothetical protein
LATIDTLPAIIGYIGETVGVADLVKI